MASEKYTCVFCDYSARCTRSTSKEDQFNRHCLSKRHIRKKENNIKLTKETKPKNKIERLMKENERLMKENKRLMKENEWTRERNYTLRWQLRLIANTVKKAMESAMAP